MNDLIVSVSGIRGIVGQGLTAETALAFASALGTHLDGGRIVLSRDGRASGGMLRHAVLAGEVYVQKNDVRPQLGASGQGGAGFAGGSNDFDLARLVQKRGQVLGRKGFVFNNPNAKTTCGCGSSFGA